MAGAHKFDPGVTQRLLSIRFGGNWLAVQGFPAQNNQCDMRVTFPDNPEMADVIFMVAKFDVVGTGSFAPESFYEVPHVVTKEDLLKKSFGVRRRFGFPFGIGNPADETLVFIKLSGKPIRVRTVIEDNGGSHSSEPIVLAMFSKGVLKPGYVLDLTHFGDLDPDGMPGVGGSADWSYNASIILDWMVNPAALGVDFIGIV